MINPMTMKRLAIMKQIFSHGQEHRHKHAPMSNMLACHNYDLSIEILLLIIGTELGTTLSKEMKFWDLWNEVNIKFKGKFNADLPLKHEIQPLRDARNSIQHSGTIPSDSDIERFEGYSRTFLDNAIIKVFSINFDDIRLSELIKDASLKGHLISAEDLISQTDFMTAIEKLSLAFENGQRKAIKNIYQSDWSKIVRPFGFREIEEKIGRSAIKELEEAFKKTEGMLSMLALKLDYREYLNFKKKSFRILWSLGESEPRVSIPDGEVRSKDDAVFCYNFVLNSFITWEL